MAAVQRLLTVAAGEQIHADCHQAVVGLGDHRRRECQLYEEQRSNG